MRHKVELFWQPHTKFVILMLGANFATMINNVPEGYFDMSRWFLWHLEHGYMEKSFLGPGGSLAKYPRFWGGSFT